MDKTSGEAEVMRMGDAFGRQAPRAPTEVPALVCPPAPGPRLPPTCCARLAHLDDARLRPRPVGQPA